MVIGDEPHDEGAPTSAAGVSNNATIDHQYYPHIIDGIWQSIDCFGALTTRMVSRDWNLRAHRVLLRHVAATQIGDGVKMTPVDRTQPQQPVPHSYGVFFVPARTGESGPAEAPPTIPLLDAIRVIDIATPVSEEHAFLCYSLLQQLHQRGKLETVRLWLQEGCDLVTYGKTQVLHARWDNYPSVEMHGAEHVVLNLVSASSEYSPVFTVMGPDLDLWHDIKLLPSIHTLKSVTIILKHEFQEDIGNRPYFDADEDLPWYANYLCDSLQTVWLQFPTRLVGLEDVFKHEPHRIALREHMIRYLEETETCEIVRHNLHIITRQEYEAVVGSEAYRLHTQIP
ncbi:hypothetical protein A1Q2_08449 [Trichosporon asahii var. asahii CBS 8904]|uniref:Uncharacterized protein n=1 Tax=Trichosporon asahii var. asahii (strain CBS 8904) TaxID=1220162 RepID=K1VDY3_TRIAC|nr:hypothetical protein A1Q2_08449 [Trichosporon asahii var. asahii CBS 8904]